MATSNGHAATSVKNPGSYDVGGGFRAVLIGFAIIGAIAFALTVGTDPTRAWSAILTNHFYFMSIAVGGLFFAAIQWLTGAMWSAPVRRISEAATAYLPVALVTVILLWFGVHHLYNWSHAELLKTDHELALKAGWMNTTGFIVRNAIVVGIWIFFAKVLVGNSLRQDKEGGFTLTARNRALSPAFLIIFGVTFTLASFDLMMSLDAHWYSTIFGIYCFAGLFYSILAMTCIVTLHLKDKGRLEGIVNDNHLHDIGKFMFAFTIFWAYIAFAQFMLIWYANLPEETEYYIRRLHGGWAYVSLFLLVGKFLVPFFLLLPRRAKREEKRLYIAAWFMMVAQWIDVIWMVQPEFYADGPHIGFAEIGIALGFIGVFGLLVARFLAKNNIVAVGDPRLLEAIEHHHQ